MEIGIGVWAFVVYLAVVIVWNAVIKRSITEAMLLGFLVAAAFGGIDNYITTVVEAFCAAATDEIFVATMMFVFMSAIMTKTGIIGELIEILNSLVGRLRGGPGYVAVLASGMLGLVSGNSTANAATVGTITIPWLVKTGWPRELAATLTAGNAGSGQSFPASSAMFLMLGMAEVAALVTIDTFYVAMLTAGLWCVAYRLLVVRFYVGRNHIQATPQDQILPLGESLKKNWPALMMFVSIIVPLVLTLSPLAGVLESIPSFGEDGVGSISIVVWVPILMSIIAIIEGWKRLPHSVSGWIGLLKETQSNFLGVGGVFLFAIAGSSALSSIGFGDDLSALLAALHLPKVVMVFIVGALVALVGGPLGGVATTMATGLVAFTALVGVGCSPVAALAAFLIWMSTEGASPPSSPPIFVACSLADVKDVGKTFFPLVFHYVIPITILGGLIALGVLPIANA